MARKSIKGYAEKNYYDNTRFNGGIIATNDPLNEGYFKHLVNFDISDMGQSLTPRKGFLTTTSKLGEYPMTLGNKNIYFYEINIGKYIYVDLVHGVDPSAFSTSLIPQNNFISDCIIIDNIDTSDIEEKITDFKTIELCGTHKALYCKDEYNVDCYIINVKYNEEKFIYLKFIYNESEKTLIVSCLDTEQIVNYIDINYRNIASTQSVIPEPMQIVYTDNPTESNPNKTPIGHVDKFPMIYLKQNGKYLINTANTIDGTTIIPNFYIKEPADNYQWAYTYDIVSTSTNLLYKGHIFKGSVYTLNDNTLIRLVDSNPESTYILEKYIQYIRNAISDENVMNNSPSEYTNFVKSLDYTIPQPTYIIYAVPDPEIRYSIPDDEYYTLRDCKCETVHRAFRNYVVTGISPGITIGGIVLDSDLLEVIKESTYEEAHINYQDKFSKCIYMYNYINSVLNSNDSANNRGNIVSNCIKTLNSGEVNYTLNCVPATHVYVEDPLNSDTDIYYLDDILNDYKQGMITLSECLQLLKKLNFTFILRNFNSSVPYDTLEAENVGYTGIQQTCINSQIFAVKKDDEWNMSYEDILKVLESVGTSTVLLDVMNTTTLVNVPNDRSSVEPYNAHAFNCLFPKKGSVNESTYNTYVVCTHMNMCTFNSDGTLEFSDQADWVHHHLTDGLGRDYMEDYTNLIFQQLTNYNGVTWTIQPNLYSKYINNTFIERLYISSLQQESEQHFFTKDNNILQCECNELNKLYKILKSQDYFANGMSIIFYLMCIPNKDQYELYKYIAPELTYSREYFTNTTPLKITRTIYIDNAEPSTYIEQLETEPQQIISASNYLIYNSILGDHLVVYTGNKVFISKENMQYYFIYDYVKEFPEPIVKVIQYKEMLLVFTVQNLYAIYLYEVTTTEVIGQNDDGSDKYGQVSSWVFASLPVLYNLRVDERYADAIQVYNQMVLFYSADGQMFLIKPTAAIESNTRFSIQYFNKSANDILLNYKNYMQERLESYGVYDKTITDVDIKVVANINYIKIFYTAPGIMTYILVYDVLNNRYYSYDTLSFSMIHDVLDTSLGEVYITEHTVEYETGPVGSLYFTLQHNTPDYTNVDVTFYNYFSPQDIRTEIDTGTLNLNNHLKKRFKDLHVIYKNLSANELEFALSTYVDDIPIVSYIETNFEVRNNDGFNTLVTQDTMNVQQLVENAALFNFSSYSSNKIITHKTNIISKGKSIRIKMNFNSKGKYKIQGYGLIYKEHTI